jgi:hypothetical protein
MLRRSVPTGIVVALAAVTAFAQQPAQRGGMFNAFRGLRMPAGILLMMPEVQTELKITDEQKTKMATIRQEVQQEVQKELIGSFDFQALRDLSQEERDKKLGEVRTKIEGLIERVDGKVEKVLESEQMKRLRQLRLQSEGAAAFSQPEVVAKLKLTDEQKTEIKKIQDESLGQFRGINRNSTAEERQAAFAKIQESRAKSLKSILAALGDDQLLDWNEMTGKEFKFPANMMGALRGMGGGFGGGMGAPPPSNN